MLNNTTGYSSSETEIEQQLQHLYLRLDTVNNLIRCLQDYELRRPKPLPVLRERSA